VSADQAAEAALAGLDQGKQRVAPGLPGRLLDLGGRLVPSRLIAPVLRRVIQRNV
jgi:short-subunit dehydrogenase